MVLPLNSEKSHRGILSERGDSLNCQYILTWGIGGVYPEKLSELGRLSELSVPELTVLYAKGKVICWICTVECLLAPHVSDDWVLTKKDTEVA